MGYGIRLKVWGDYACFTRPEMKVERVSYDVMTPSAARGILEAIYWKPQIRWIIDEITVLNAITFENIRRNELTKKISPQTVKRALHGNEVDIHLQRGQENIAQRATLFLKNVAYIINAHFEMTGINATAEDTKEKHYNMAQRRIDKGQCYHHPYFGCREFPVSFTTAGDEEESYYKGTTRDLGYMLWDINFKDEMIPVFYRPVMKDGKISVPNLWEGGN